MENSPKSNAIEKLFLLRRTLKPRLALTAFQQKDRGLPCSNAEAILLSLSSRLIEEQQKSINECVPIDFCDNI